jgi:hypothetical protein
VPYASTVSLDRTTIIATGAATVTLGGTPGSTVRLFAYSQPSTTFTQVRELTVGSAGTSPRR